MKRPRYLQWLALFDIEPMLSTVLRYGTYLCFVLIIASGVIHRIEGRGSFGGRMQASSVVTLVLKDFQSVPRTSARPLLDLALLVLMLTPYLRLWASMFYVTWVERNKKYMLFTGFVLLVLTIIVLTDLV